MQFTGKELVRKRNIYTQNANFGFAMDCYVDNTTGSYTFGISGTSGAFAFTLQSGRIMLANQFLCSYAANERFYIECQLTSDKYNVLKDQVPMVYGLGKTSGDFNYLFFSRENSSLFADFDFYASGQNEPNVAIDEVGYLLSSDQNAVTGYVRNLGSYPLQIFDSDAQNNQTLDFGKIYNTTVTGIYPFAFTGGFDQYDFSLPPLLDFNTNFADTTAVTFTIIDARSLNRFVFLQNISDYSFNSSDQLNRTLFYTNYSGGFVTDSFQTNLIFSLQYVSGSGQFSTNSALGGIPYSTTLYGNFAQSGIVTGQYTVVTGTDNLSGSYLLSLSQFSWATGLATGYFNSFGTGLASGIGYTGAAYGPFTGSFTGRIYAGSGTLSFNSLTSGASTNASSIDYQGYVNATGWLNISGLDFNDILYIGASTTPIIKGIQFNNETGLIYYLSGEPSHQVEGYVSGGVIYLDSRVSGSAGNSITIISDNCNVGSAQFSSALVGGQNIGSTGINVVPIGPFWNVITQIATGSGYYSIGSTGIAAGTFYYTKTFTGQWDILTGIDQTNLISLKRTGNFTSNVISGVGIFDPNSQVNFQINHVADIYNQDTALLIISGQDVLNPIIQQITI